MTPKPSQEHPSVQDEEPHSSRLGSTRHYLRRQIEQINVDAPSEVVIDEAFLRRPSDLITELRDVDSRYLCALMASSPEFKNVLANPDTETRVTLNVEETQLTLMLVDFRNRAIRLVFDDTEQRVVLSFVEVDDEMNELSAQQIVQHALTDGQSDRLIRDIESVGNLILQKRTAEEMLDTRRGAEEAKRLKARALIEAQKPQASTRIQRALGRVVRSRPTDSRHR